MIDEGGAFAAVAHAKGDVIAGKYEVERRIGAGGMGVVLAVRHRELGELYALKLMLPAAAASAAARERFAREARAAAKLKSEHVARAIDFGFLPEEGPPYMVLELLTGQNLAERLAGDGVLEAREVAALMLHACDALREAHEHGIVHRDLKPSNLFLTKRPSGADCLKVLDFGIAKTVVEGGGALTKTATTMGSPFYMSPEQMRSAKSADERSDIWSLGVTMFELVTGRVPFVGETVTEVAITVIEAAVPSPREYRPDLPEAMERVILRCLQKSPARRYPSIDALALDLAHIAGEPWTPRDAAARAPQPSESDALALARTEPEGASGAGLPPTVFGQPIDPEALAADATPGGAEAAATGPSATTSGVARTRPPPAPRRSRTWLAALALVPLGAVAWLTLGGAPPEAPAKEGGAGVATPPSRGPTEAAAGAPSASAASLDLRDEGADRALTDAIRAVVDAHKEEKQQCYDMARSAAPELKGKFEVHFTIRADGTTKAIRVDGDELPTAVKNCFVGVFSQMTFPEPPGGNEITAAFPIELTPAPPAAGYAKGIPQVQSKRAPVQSKKEVLEQRANDPVDATPSLSKGAPSYGSRANADGNNDSPGGR